MVIKNGLFISKDNIKLTLSLFVFQIILIMTQIEIPSELPTILRNFTLSVLRTKPRDIIGHAVDYFTQLQQQQQKQQPEQLTPDNNPVTIVSFPSFSSASQQQQTSNHNAKPSGP
jgi:hypothetical protein